MILTIFLLLQAASTIESQWIFSQRTDPITDLHGGTATILAIDGQSRLALTCNVAEPAQLLSFQYIPGGARRYLGSRDNSVTVRVDHGSPMTWTWTYAGHAAYITEVTPVYQLARSMADASQVTIRALNYEGQPIDATFNIGGARAVFAQVLDHCNRPPLDSAVGIK